MRFVIIGAGVAAVAACQAIRERDSNSEVEILTEESLGFYTRLRLPEVVAGKVDPNKLVLKGPEWFRSHGLKLRLLKKARAVLAGPLRVVADDGEEFSADRVLIATGAESFVPPVQGARLPNVFTLRRMSDAFAIRDRAGSARNGVVIGGGVLGFEVAEALKSRGLNVTVIELAERLLPKQTDAECSAIIKEIVEKKGIRVILGVSPVKFEIRGREADALRLADMSRIEADIFIFSAGVTPRSDVASSSGIKFSRGIEVNDSLQTSFQGVYAAGDCAEYRGVCYGTWRAAEEQGRLAGMAMTGMSVSYQGSVRSYRLNLPGASLLAVGTVENGEGCQCELEKDREKGIYRKIVRKDGHLVGFLLLGDLRGYKELLAEIEDRTRHGT